MPDKPKFIPYNSTLIAKARNNRNNPTPAESRLWRVLRGKQLPDIAFRRQKPIAEYIVDFYCAELLLEVEVDGDSHAYNEVYDQRRTQRLHELGIVIVRYSNREVLTNLEGVFDNLSERVQARRRLVEGGF